MSALRLTTYQELKDQLLGPVGSAERPQFGQELGWELVALASAPPPAPKATNAKKPR